MLDICGVTEAQMPRIFESSECVGTVKKNIADELGIGSEVIVAAGAGDNAAAAVGTGTVGDGHWEQAVQYSFQARNSEWIPIMHCILSHMRMENIILRAVYLVPHQLMDGGWTRYSELMITQVNSRR